MRVKEKPTPHCSQIVDAARALIKDRGMKQKDLARETGLTPSTITNLFQGKMPGKSTRSIQALSQYLARNAAPLIRDSMGTERTENDCLASAVSTFVRMTFPSLWRPHQTFLDGRVDLAHRSGMHFSKDSPHCVDRLRYAVSVTLGEGDDLFELGWQIDLGGNSVIERLCGNGEPATVVAREQVDSSWLAADGMPRQAVGRGLLPVVESFWRVYAPWKLGENIALTGACSCLDTDGAWRQDIWTDTPWRVIAKGIGQYHDSRFAGDSHKYSKPFVDGRHRAGLYDPASHLFGVGYMPVDGVNRWNAQRPKYPTIDPSST